MKKNHHIQEIHTYYGRKKIHIGAYISLPEEEMFDLEEAIFQAKKEAYQENRKNLFRRLKNFLGEGIKPIFPRKYIVIKLKKNSPTYNSKTEHPVMITEILPDKWVYDLPISVKEKHIEEVQFNNVPAYFYKLKITK